MSKLVFRPRGSIVIIDLDKVMYMKQDGKKLSVHTLIGERVFRNTLSDIETKLDRNFIKCHKSCIINIDLVDEIVGSTICFCDGTRIFVCENCGRQLRDALAEYLSSADLDR